MGEMRVFTPRGPVLGGADAHAHLWGQVWWLWPMWLASKIPGIHGLIDVSYRWVAANRYRLMPAKDACDDRCAIPKTDFVKTETPK
jgi:predicted DCC family thiol-disulfide oxidoreductase YuxK